jgi:hypothetical protein
MNKPENYIENIEGKQEIIDFLREDVALLTSADAERREGAALELENNNPSLALEIIKREYDDLTNSALLETEDMSRDIKKLQRFIEILSQ